MALSFFFAPFVFLAVARTHVARTVEATLEDVPKKGDSRQQTLREALLCTARSRINNWYYGGERKLGGGGVKDGVELHFAGTAPCGGADISVLFANWSLKGVKPKHVFSALTNFQHQEWNSDLVRTHTLRTFPKLHTVGRRLEYSAGPAFSHRKVYEWETFDKANDGKEYWFAASSTHNQALKKLDTNKESNGFFSFGGGTVEADSCLSAHRIRETKDGVEAVFTNTINAHPPMGISQNFISTLTWGKTVDFVKALQNRALELAQLDDSQLVLPDSDLLPEEDVHVPAQCSSKWDEAEEELDALAEKDLLMPSSNVLDYEASWAPRSNAAAGAALLGVSLLAFAAFRAWSKPRYTSLSEPVDVAASVEHLVRTDVEAPGDSSS
jgi:hypothetical protein